MLLTKFILLRVLLLTLTFSGVSRATGSHSKQSSQYSGDDASLLMGSRGHGHRWTRGSGQPMLRARGARLVYVGWIQDGHCPNVNDWVRWGPYKHPMFEGEKVVFAPGYADFNPVVAWSRQNSITHVLPHYMYVHLTSEHLTKLQAICPKTNEDNVGLRLYEAQLHRIKPTELYVFRRTGGPMGKKALQISVDMFGQSEETKVFEVVYKGHRVDEDVFVYRTCEVDKQGKVESLVPRCRLSLT